MFVGASLLAGAAAHADEQAAQVAAPQVEPTFAPAESYLEPIEKPAPGIIIPYDAGTDPLASQRVFLSHDQFLKLWNRAHPEQQLPATAPVDGLVSEALYAAKLEGEGLVTVSG